MSFIKQKTNKNKNKSKIKILNSKIGKNYTKLLIKTVIKYIESKSKNIDRIKIV